LKRMRQAITKIQAIIIICIVVVAGVGVGVAWYVTRPEEKEKEAIKIGFTLSKSGYAATGSYLLHERMYTMWKEQVNAEGGIYVEELDKTLPVEFVWYDDASDIETLIRLYEKLMVEDKVDFILPPWGTGFNLPLIPLITKYGYPLLSSTCVSLLLNTMAAPYFYVLGGQTDITTSTYEDFLVSIKDEAGLTNVALVYPDTDFGIENGIAHKTLLEADGFDVVLFEMYPATATDLSPLLLEAKEKDVDTFWAWSYPEDSALLIGTAMGIGFNPKVFYTAIGVGLPAILQAFGEAANGLMTLISWHPSMTTAAQELYDAYLERWDEPPTVVGDGLTWMGLQILQQAIDKAGSLDREKVKEALDTETFSTIIGDITFTHKIEGGAGFNLVTPPLGQVQNGEYEVIWPTEYATAEWIPKPPWP